MDLQPHEQRVVDEKAQLDERLGKLFAFLQLSLWIENAEMRSSSYRQLNEAEAALMNEIKAHAEETRALVNRVQQHVDASLREPLPEGHAPHSQVTNPMRWAALAQTELQTGYMMLVRAVAQPSTF